MRKLYSSVIIFIICIASVSNLKAATYVYVSGSLSSLASWSAVPSGTAPTSFTGTNTWSIGISGTLTLSTTWTVAPAGTVIFGDGTNPLTFVMANTIGTNPLSSTAHPNLTIRNNATFIAQATQAFAVNRITNNVGSTFRYDAGYTNDIVAVSGGYYNLIINNNATINSSTPVVVNGTLTINSGKTLALNGSPLTINNSISGSGEIIGDNGGSSVITIAGSGNVGTINFQTGSAILTGLTLTSGTLTLGSDLSIDGSSFSGNSALILTAGALILNGHTLSLDNSSTATFSGGTIVGSSSGSLLFNSTTSISGSLNMASSGNTLKALYLNAPGQTLTLGNALNITDSISALDGTIDANGNLTLLATASLRARVGMMGATGSIINNATAQVYFNGGTTGWRQMGVGGTSGNTISSWDSQFPMTCTGCTYDPTSLSPTFYSIQGWTESAGDYDISLTSGTPLTPGQGFWVYLGTTSSASSPITISTTGPLVTGQATQGVTASGNGTDPNFNLLANPYASPISWDKLYNFNTQGPNNLANGFITVWDANTGTDLVLGVGSGVIIPAGQGFYVECQQFFDFTMVFDESVKTADNTGGGTMASGGTLFTRLAAQTSTISGFKLKIEGSNGDADKTEFRFDASATVGYDRHYDAHKMYRTPGYQGTAATWDHYTSISSMSPNHKYAVNTLPVLTNSVSIPVLARVSATGVYSISVSDVHNYGSCTILKDNFTGAYHDLSVSPYVCTIDDSTTFAPRFELVMCAMSSPVSVKELNASAGKIQVLQDENGAFVTTHFDASTKATISVFNVIGQQLIKDLQVEGTDTNTRLNVDSHNEVLLVKVTTSKETVTTKIITH